jgi:hypothetical protein
MCESDSPFRGRNPVWRGPVMSASLEFANRFVSYAIALPPRGRAFAARSLPRKSRMRLPGRGGGTRLDTGSVLLAIRQAST